MVRLLCTAYAVGVPSHLCNERSRAARTLVGRAWHTREERSGNLQLLLHVFEGASAGAGHSIAWTLYFLTKHPAAMAKLEAELDQAGLLATPARPHPREFVYADIGKLPYLDACIKARPLPWLPNVPFPCDYFVMMCAIRCSPSATMKSSQDKMHRPVNRSAVTSLRATPIWCQTHRRYVLEVPLMWYYTAQEAMRLQPVASQAVRRQVLRDVRLADGRVIPKGCIVLCANFSMMRNPAWGWGSDAGEFVPVRWFL